MGGSTVVTAQNDPLSESKHHPTVFVVITQTKDQDGVHKSFNVPP